MSRKRESGRTNCVVRSLPESNREGGRELRQECERQDHNHFSQQSIIVGVPASRPACTVRTALTSFATHTQHIRKDMDKKRVALYLEGLRTLKNNQDTKFMKVLISPHRKCPQKESI